MYTPDETVIHSTILLLAAGAAFQLFDGIQTVATGALRGAGDTRTPCSATSPRIGLLVFRSVAWLCSTGLGRVWPLGRAEPGPHSDRQSSCFRLATHGSQIRCIILSSNCSLSIEPRDGIELLNMDVTATSIQRARPSFQESSLYSDHVRNSADVCVRAVALWESFVQVEIPMKKQHGIGCPDLDSRAISVPPPADKRAASARSRTGSEEEEDARPNPIANQPSRCRSQPCPREFLSDRRILQRGPKNVAAVEKALGCNLNWILDSCERAPFWMAPVICTFRQQRSAVSGEYGLRPLADYAPLDSCRTLDDLPPSSGHRHVRSQPAPTAPVFGKRANPSNSRENWIASVSIHGPWIRACRKHHIFSRYTQHSVRRAGTVCLVLVAPVLFVFWLGRKTLSRLLRTKPPFGSVTCVTCNGPLAAP